MTRHFLSLGSWAGTNPPEEKFALALRTFVEARHRAEAGMSNRTSQSVRHLRRSATWQNAFDVSAALPVADNLWQEFSRRVEQQFVISSLSASLTFLYDRSSRLESQLHSLRNACALSERSLGSRISSLEGLLGVTSRGESREVQRLSDWFAPSSVHDSPITNESASPEDRDLTWTDPDAVISRFALGEVRDTGIRILRDVFGESARLTPEIVRDPETSQPSLVFRFDVQRSLRHLRGQFFARYVRETVIPSGSPPPALKWSYFQ